MRPFDARSSFNLRDVRPFYKAHGIRYLLDSSTEAALNSTNEKIHGDVPRQSIISMDLRGINKYDTI